MGLCPPCSDRFSAQYPDGDMGLVTTIWRGLGAATGLALQEHRSTGAQAGSGAQHTPVLRAPADLVPSGYMGETTKHSLSWHKTNWAGPNWLFLARGAAGQ